MPKGHYERKPKEPDTAMIPPVNENAEPEKLFPVVLLKNHCPSGNFEIVGYLKDAVKVKDAAGNWTVLEKERFVEGEMKPHTSPGVGFPGKIWAGTHIKLPLDEAKRLVAAKAAERADVIAA